MAKKQDQVEQDSMDEFADNFEEFMFDQFGEDIDDVRELGCKIWVDLYNAGKINLKD